MPAWMGEREHDVQTQHCPINTGKQRPQIKSVSTKLSWHQTKLESNEAILKHCYPLG